MPVIYIAFTITELVVARLSVEEQFYAQVANLLGAEVAEALQEATMDRLDQYQKGRFEVYVDTSALDKSVDKLAWLGRQVVIAMMLVGMIVGSAIATSIIAFVQPEGQYWDFASCQAYLGFVVPIFIAILYCPPLAVVLDQRRCRGAGLRSAPILCQEKMR